MAPRDTEVQMERLTRTELIAEIEAQEFWYHDLELAEGIWTGAPFHHSTPASREILKNVDVADAYFLDIGAMDGFFSILAARRGATRIIASDRLDLTRKISLVQRSLGVSFEYAPSIGLNKLGERLQRSWGRFADVVMFSGVLYHMFDPMAGLTRVRGFVRQGGIVIVETVAAITDEALLQFN